MKQEINRVAKAGASCDGPGCEGDVSERLATFLSLGVGVQSVTLALLAKHGEIEPMPDAAVFADTWNEAPDTYRYLWWLASEAGLPFPVWVTSAGDLGAHLLRAAREGSRADAPPVYTLDGTGKHMLLQKCTKAYKVAPLHRAYRRLAGLSWTGRVAGQIEQWTGISVDEVHRMKPSKVLWIERRYPLIELRMRRLDCVLWLQKHGYPIPPKSACVFCPYTSNARWRQLRERDGQGWAKAVEMDRTIRVGLEGSRGEAYLHRLCLPLPEAVEVDDSQIDLFGNECEGLCGV